MRKKVNERRIDLLAAGERAAERYGFFKFTAAQVAEEAGVTRPLLNAHFTNVIRFRGELVKFLIAQENLNLLLEILASRKDGFKNMIPNSLRLRIKQAFVDGYFQ